MHQGEKAGMLPAKEQGGYGRRKTGMLLGTCRDALEEKRLGWPQGRSREAPRKERKERECSRKRRLVWSQGREERTGMLWGQKAGMVLGKGQGHSVAPGPCISIQQLHNSRAQPPTAGPQQPSFHQPQAHPSACPPQIK